MEQLQQLIRAISQRQDLVIVGFVLSVICLMILPLPTWLMDLTIAVNITIGLLFILLAIYLKQPLEFSTLPSAVLIATLMRIAITIATSRLILLQADAGQIIKSFGTFVIAGNVVVGLVIFAIIAIAQFVVITRGAERVAEVAARFSLDALPGKQMSIDSDLRAGDIDRHEARERRLNLEYESQYYGSMDGAMKFVKGDAIVSMVIIFVNLVGGILVGTMVHSMDVSTAFSVYALLTVGDGLASQIPALLVAVASGIVVTRVTTEDSQNLGADLGRELVSSMQTLAIVAIALFGLGFVPGFPTLTFVALGLLFAAGAVAIWMSERRKKAEAEAKEIESKNTEGLGGVDLVPESRRSDVFTLRLAPDVGEGLDKTQYAKALQETITNASLRLGIVLPAPGLFIDESLQAQRVCFDVERAEAWRNEVPIGQVFVHVDPSSTKSKVQGGTVRELPGLGRGVWLDSDAASLGSSEDGLDPVNASAALGRIVGALVERWASRAFGLQEASLWLTALGNEGFGGLVEQIRQSVHVTRIADTLRHLSSENVALTQPRLILEAMLEYAPRVEDNASLCDHIRLSLARPLSAQYAREDRTIAACVIELDLEEYMREAVRETPNGLRLSLPYDEANRLANAITYHAYKDHGVGPAPVILTSFDLRRPVRQFVTSRNIDVPVLAFEEMANDFQAIPVARFDMSTLSGKQGEENYETQHEAAE